MASETKNDKASNPFKHLYSDKRGIDRMVFDAVLTLSVEIAREGREGRKIGTLFTIGDTQEVLKYSRELILDPLYGHPEPIKRITHHDMRETIKELAQLDGAFVISNDGIAISACRYLEAPTQGVKLALGLGSRHMAAAAVTKHTRAVAVVVSESSVVRVFDDGEVIAEIIPELWMFSNFSLHLSGPYSELTHRQMRVVAKTD
ncbi:MAG TPA: diadenylate cyclase [Tepidisphaeraceae bacterium]|nr:diadenylate cyclase [Tepidisphaeraceae bacterium]